MTAEMVTWSDPDGGNVAGTDYTFVTGPEWFDDLDLPWERTDKAELLASEAGIRQPEPVSAG